MGRLVKIVKDNFPTYADQLIEIEGLSFPYPWSLSAFRGELDKPVSNLWAMASDKTLLAYICFWLFDNEIQIVNFAVHPLKRRQHLGQHLLTEVIRLALSNGISCIWLEVRPSNRIARSLYSKFGFREIGRRQGYYSETNEDAIIMALELSEKGSNYQILNYSLENRR